MSNELTKEEMEAKLKEATKNFGIHTRVINNKNKKYIPK